jgi:hypothetical protein
LLAFGILEYITEVASLDFIHGGKVFERVACRGGCRGRKIQSDLVQTVEYPFDDRFEFDVTFEVNPLGSGWPRAFLNS